MRVTSQTKAATRKLILQSARRLFAANGYEQTRTRDIADAAGIASGTLFNYFQTKEAIVACLAAEALEDAAAAHATPASAAFESLEAELFALVAYGLRKLKPLRRHLPALLETSLSPLAVAAKDESATLRALHLQAIATITARHGFASLSPIALQLYWTLYTGVLVFWANDRSPKQEETLALIDDSLNMFVAWLRTQSHPTAPGDQPTH
jgi:AcrR family transcriptional regulator